ncbi:MAG: integrase arm-type DNA-binding domain-containing protein, partial [Alphaproteobacteria bacterium]|nr:integrase arm-type DNA-binding domain-containing protein [Alphaproteobacteria bacterium]
MAERITDSFVKSLGPSEGRQKIYFDGDTDTQKHITGFGVRVTAKGTRAFILEYWLGGRQRRYTIGKYPDWSVERARKRAKELRQMVNLDQDPMDQRNKLRTDPTVKKLAERYYEEHLPTKAPQSQIDDRKMIEDEILPRLGKRKVAEIHYNDIKALHRSITDRGAPVRANRVLAVCSKMFSLTLVPRAGETDRWRTPVQGNPCKGVERNSEAGREHFYSAAEIERIADALERFPGRNAANLIRFVMLTGCRPGEAMKATWDQFDLDAGGWTKPGSTTKQRKTHRIPLAAAAIELLQHIRADKELPQNKRKENDCSFVFPGRKRAGQDWQS